MARKEKPINNSPYRDHVIETSPDAFGRISKPFEGLERWKQEQAGKQMEERLPLAAQQRMGCHPT